MKRRVATVIVVLSLGLLGCGGADAAPSKPQPNVEVIERGSFPETAASYFAVIRVDGRDCILYGSAETSGGGSISCDWSQK